VETVVSSSEFIVDDANARNFNDKTFGSSVVLKSPIELHNAYFAAGVLAAAIFIVAVVVSFPGPRSPILILLLNSPKIPDYPYKVPVPERGKLYSAVMQSARNAIAYSFRCRQNGSSCSRGFNQKFPNRLQPDA